jgi:LysR family transcriptional regulator, benzoate and cis,cis-muconate-responsive activator of ben and cat genes
MHANISLDAQMYVLVLAREGSIHRAAKLLRITQPSLTRKINKIETELGVRLFQRSPRGLELTQAGRLFIPEAQASMQHAERAWELARREAEIEAGPLRLGCSPGVHLDLSTMLQRWQLRNLDNPRPVLLESAITIELMERVLKGQLHLAFGISPIDNEELWVHPITREPFCLCIPKNHALAQKGVISAKDLHGEIVFWLPRSLHPALYDRMVEYVASLDVQPIFHEVSAVTQAMDTVAYDFGLALLPRSMVRFSRSGVVFKPLTDLFLQIETVMFVRQDQRHGPLQEYIQAILSHIRSVQKRAI